jgi:hypothetical protein
LPIDPFAKTETIFNVFAGNSEVAFPFEELLEDSESLFPRSLRDAPDPPRKPVQYRYLF